jgi:hypothetical protein
MLYIYKYVNCWSGWVDTGIVAFIRSNTVSLITNSTTSIGLTIIPLLISLILYLLRIASHVIVYILLSSDCIYFISPL